MFVGGVRVLHGQGPSAPRSGGAVELRTTRALPLSAGGITLDGRLDEAAWGTAPVADAFVQREPKPGQAARRRTEARVVYDARTLYVGMRMFDPAPDSIRTLLARRDEQVTGSDWVSVEIDSYNDRRTAFRFFTNPAGSRVDILTSDDTRHDVTWDAAWDVVTRIDSLGWVAEFAIPLSQLRYSTAGDDEARAWGIQFMRESARDAEVSYWSPMPPQAGRHVSLFGRLSGLDALRGRRRVELLPYVATRTTRAPGDVRNPFYEPARYAGNVGGEFKLGVGSSFTVTGTVNPDFGQVEQDPSVVNLGAFEQFFAERRPFFTEGAEIFAFPLVPEGQVFYSRRVGRSPQRTVRAPSGGYVDTPETAPIHAAVKFSGKTASGWSLGVLQATTGSVQARLADASGRLLREPVEPAAQFGVLRVSRDFRRGRSSVGFIATTTQRDLEDERLQGLRRSAQVGGVNWFHQFSRDRFRASGWLVGSDLRGSPASILALQTNAVHRFQRPDAEYLAVDSSATTMRGWAGEAYLRKIAGNWTFNVGGGARSPGVDVNESGFQTYADVFYALGTFGYRDFTPGKVLRSWNANVTLIDGYSYGAENARREVDFNGSYLFNNLIEGTYSLQRWLPSLSTWELRGGPGLLMPAHSDWNLSLSSNKRRNTVAAVVFRGTHQEETSRLQMTVAPTLTLRPAPRASVVLQPTLVQNRDPAQYIRTVSAGGERRYLMGDLRQRTAIFVVRAGYAITKTLSVDVYAQPFGSVGDFRQLREVVAPRASRFVDRMTTFGPDRVSFDSASRTFRIDRDADGVVDYTAPDPDFAVREFRSNTVLRWEYRPGATLFLAWSQARDDRTFVPGGGSLGDDARRLFGIVPRNVVQLKVSYWQPM
jgi:hypothetical protein